MIRVVFTKVTDGKVRTFSATGREGESFSGREFMQQFGCASLPKEGASGAIIYNGNYILAIVSDDDRYRPELQEGETVLYDAFGQKVHLKEEGIVASSAKKITAIAPEINLGGDRAELLALIDERLLLLFNSHTHPGVMPGSSSTAVPAVPLTAALVCTKATKAK